MPQFEIMVTAIRHRLDALELLAGIRCSLNKRLDVGQPLEAGESRLEEKVDDGLGGIKTITWLAKCEKAGCTTCPGVTVEMNPNGTQNLACGMCEKAALPVDPG